MNVDVAIDNTYMDRVDMDIMDMDIMDMDNLDKDTDMCTYVDHVHTVHRLP